MEIPFSFISLMCQLLDFLDVSSLIMHQVFYVFFYVRIRTENVLRTRKLVH